MGRLFINLVKQRVYDFKYFKNYNSDTVYL